MAAAFEWLRRLKVSKFLGLRPFEWLKPFLSLKIWKIPLNNQKLSNLETIKNKKTALASGFSIFDCVTIIQQQSAQRKPCRQR